VLGKIIGEHIDNFAESGGAYGNVRLVHLEPLENERNERFWKEPRNQPEAGRKEKSLPSGSMSKKNIYRPDGATVYKKLSSAAGNRGFAATVNVAAIGAPGVC
jgi:hypothetical protein